MKPATAWTDTHGAPARAVAPMSPKGNAPVLCPEVTVASGSLQMRSDMIEPAVIPAGPVRLLQVHDRNVVVTGEGVDVAPEAVPDLLDNGRRLRAPPDQPVTQGWRTSTLPDDRAVLVSVVKRI